MNRRRRAPEEPPEPDSAGVKLEEPEDGEELLLDASGLSCSQESGSRDSDLLPSQELSWSSQDSSSSLGPTGDGNMLLLQPAMGRRHGDHCEDRASRPGKSRIPGRDHRRYYHSHWRMEYLMDFDSRCHGMICMVCGSSLATLKLSTIKRHIRQKHPYSVNWSVKEKEVIINSWDAHLSMEALPPGSKEADVVIEDGLHGDSEVFGLPGVRRRRRRLPSIAKRLRQSKGPQDTKNLEQYLNESLQSWFRVEFLMDYDSQKNKLFCMLCGNVLPTLSLDDIKQHVLEAHPTSLNFSEEEKRCILGAWSTKTMLEEVQRAEQEQQRQAAMQQQEQQQQPQVQVQQQQVVAVQEPPSILAVYKVEPLPAASPDPPVAPPPVQEAETAAPVKVPRSRHTGREHGVDLASWEMSLGGRRGRGRGQRRYFQERWRMEHLVDQNQSQNGLLCMVCGVELPAMKLSIIKAHVQESHPDSALLSPKEKAAVAEKWMNKLAQHDVPDQEPPSAEIEMEVDSQGTLQPVSEDSRKQKSPPPLPPPPPPPQSSASQETEAPAASGLTPYRSQRRNYQLRWRGEYMMDYDCRRHGLICMVCGGTLATLKISTIKRHILQVHPHSIEFGAAEKQRVLEAYSEMALHYIHTEECFQQAEDPGLHAPLLCAGRATSSRAGGAHEPVVTAQPAQRQCTEDVIVV